MIAYQSIQYEALSCTELVNNVPVYDRSGYKVDEVKLVYTIRPKEYVFYQVCLIERFTCVKSDRPNIGILLVHVYKG